ncbi:hypothetical protein Acr_00g0055300 [Actinidia rufa]|uniref:CCHC-type domain-containing protein n=1 Tax=Actinidia rufa TaxID=165716 RepID=A0A7J0DM14_9ERIC|nr:hypothetical protein Acr_00g0055300 [Actinidia rufa]
MVHGGVANQGRGGGARMANLVDVAALQVGRQPHHHPRKRALEEEEVSDGEPAIPFADYPPRVRKEQRVFLNNRNSRWETGLKIDILEFHGELSVEDFLDWVNAVEDILEFKEVPKEKRVPLVATRFRVTPQAVTAKPASSQSKPSTSTSSFKCYKCRELGHRAAECKKGDRLGKNLFVEAEEDAEEQNGEPDPTPEYEEAVNPDLEEFVLGDCVPLLIVCRAYFFTKGGGRCMASQ